MKETKIKKVESARLGEHYYDIEHKSGLRVFVCPKSFSTCFAVFGTRFGAVDRRFEDDGGEAFELPAGTAHFLEHKMFENADGTNSDTRFATLGADDNAYTTYSTTRYIFSTVKNEYECVAELVRMVQNPYFTKRTVKKEQGIIISEIAMGNDNPSYCGMENMLRGLYQNSFLRDQICGTESSVLSITDIILYKAHRAYYSPSNMALSVVGNVTPEGIIAVLDRELQGIEDREPAKTLMPNEPDEICLEYIEKRMNVSRPMFFLGFKDTKKRNDPLRKCGMSVLLSMLFSSSGEFYNRLLSENLIAPSFSFGYTASGNYAYIMISGESDVPEKVAELIEKKLKDTLDEGLSPSDFERCRRVFTAGYIRAFDSSEEIADDIIMDAWYANVEPFSLPKMLEELTPDYLTGLLSELCDKKYTLSVIRPI
ncbi:MAG: insulinase family protein [Ruminococcaceae bacterium]|nr:insulinase family protein [Oscillospiraceae bacterium]